MLKFTLKLFFLCIIFNGCSKKNSDVAMVVNGQNVTNQQISEAIETFRQNLINNIPEKALQPFSSEYRPMVARQIAANLLMIDEAKKRNIKIDTVKVNVAFTKLKEGYSNKDDFEKELVSMGETESSIKKEIEKGAMLDSLLKIILQNIDTISEQECKNFYSQNNSHYKSSPRFRVSQIFIPADSVKDKAEWEKNKNKAQALLKKIKTGKKFEDVASEYEKRKTDGDMGWFKNGDLKKELQTAIDSTKVGEISELVCTDIGFHILKKSDEEAEMLLAFDDVKTNIETMLLIKKKTDFLAKYSDSLINSAKITYNDTSLVLK